MSNLDLHIGGRDYSVACAPGEEAHVAGLGRLIDARMAALPGATGLSEARALLFVALMLADELHEAQSGQAAAAPGTGADPARLAMLAPRLAMLATRLEALATQAEVSA